MISVEIDFHCTLQEIHAISKSRKAVIKTTLQEIVEDPHATCVTIYEIWRTGEGD